MKTEIKIAKEIIAAMKTGCYEDWIEKIVVILNKYKAEIKSDK